MARIRKPKETETVTVSRKSAFHAFGLENPTISFCGRC